MSSRVWPSVENKREEMQLVKDLVVMDCFGGAVADLLYMEHYRPTRGSDSQNNQS